MFQVIMTKAETGESHALFRDVATMRDAINIVNRMNDLNAFLAKATGKAIVFFYTWKSF